MLFSCYDFRVQKYRKKREVIIKLFINIFLIQWMNNFTLPLVDMT